MRHFTQLFCQYILLIAASLLFCLACKEQEVPLGVGDNRLTGTWQLLQRTIGLDTNLVVTPIAATPAQTITFSGDGGVSTAGDAVSYYRNVKYYRVDSTAGGLQIRLIANVQELPGEPQGLRIGRDTLVLLPYFSPSLRLTFVRVR